MMKSRQLRICVALSACSLCSGAMAGSWEMFPTVQSGVSYNDNPALEPESQIRGQDRATTYLFGLAEADFVKAEPSYTVTVSPRVRHLEYPDSDFEQLSRTDYYLRGDATKVAPLHSLSLSASYDRLNVLSAEDYSPGDDIGGGGSDFENLDDIRERYRISPSFNWSLTQKDSVSAAASFTITDHKLEDTARPRADIDSLSWSLQYLRSITPRQSLGFFLSGADSDSERPGATGTCADGFDLVPDFTMDVFCPDVPAGLTPEEYAVIRAIYPYGVADAEFLTESETTTYNLSWRYQWSENTRLDLNFGQQDTTSKSTTVAFGGPAFTQDLGFDGRNYSLNLTNAGQRYRFELSASRGVTTQTDGTPSDNIELGGFFVYRLAPKLSIRVEGSGSERTSSSTFRDTTILFYRVDTSLGWRLSEKLTVSGVYIYRKRDPEEVLVTGEVNRVNNSIRKSNAFVGTITYRF